MRTVATSPANSLSKLSCKPAFVVLQRSKVDAMTPCADSDGVDEVVRGGDQGGRRSRASALTCRITLTRPHVLSEVKQTIVLDLSGVSRTFPSKFIFRLKTELPVVSDWRSQMSQAASEARQVESRSALGHPPTKPVTDGCYRGVVVNPLTPANCVNNCLVS